MRSADTAEEIAADHRTRGMHAGIAAADHAQLPPPLETARWPRRLVGWAAWGLGGLLGLLVDLAEALAAVPLRADMPLVVLLRGLVEGPPDQDAAGKAANADLARRSIRGQLVIAQRSHHYIQLDRPDLVIDAINHVVESVRAEGVHS